MDLSVFVEDIQRDHPEPLESSILRSVKRAVIEFARETDAWRFNYATQFDKAQNIYVLPLPANTYVRYLKQAYFYPRSGGERRLKVYDGVGKMHDYEGSVDSCYVTENSLVVFNSGDDGVVACEAVLQPTQGITAIDDKLSDKFYDVIRHGAVYHLLRTPAQDWKPSLSRYEIEQFYASFKEGMVLAKREARRDENKPNRKASYGGLPFSRLRQSRSNRW